LNRGVNRGSGFAAELITWQRLHGRHGLPWQGTRDPYRVWLSEVMLQQTQVATVLGYYGRFLERFPDVPTLAAAPLDDVLARWSGLGYYSRARNLHRCAQAVVAQHGGAFPRTAEALATLPGIGRSTAAAIAAFCFGERVAILDGNVKRVLSRVLGFDADLARAPAVQALWNEATALLPTHDVDVYTQGLMDLGATLCTQRRPACLHCPVAARCVARQEGAPERYPVKSRTLKRSRRTSALLWLRQGSRWWLLQRPTTGVWAALWCLPEFDSADTLQALADGWRGDGEWLDPVQHALTHLDWTLQPLVWTLPARARVPEGLDAGRWFEHAEALALGLPAPIRKLLQG
jgi:A/G-specific adenine glycosylase